jgi:hypothetical protein
MFQTSTETAEYGHERAPKNDKTSGQMIKKSEREKKTP